MKKSNVPLAIVCGLATGFLMLAVDYALDRPTVEVSVDTGNCVRAYGPKGPMTCGEALRGTYERIYVDPRKNKKPDQII